MPVAKEPSGDHFSVRRVCRAEGDGSYRARGREKQRWVTSRQAGVSIVTSEFDTSGRRTRGQTWGSAAEPLFEEEIRYNENDEVLSVVWSHGRSGADSEAQTYDFDDLGRLTDFKQGKWYAATTTVGTGGEQTAGKSWQLDELGNWRSHDDHKDGQGAFSPALDAVNFYTAWPQQVDTNDDSVPDTTLTLTIESDVARGFLYKRQERSGRYLLYRHDALGRLVEVTQETGAEPASHPGEANS